MLLFFTAGLLFLCLEHVKHLGAYRIPQETGLLIPSDKAELDDAALSMERVVEGNPSNAGWRRGPRWRINFGVQTGVQLARFRRPISGLNGAESTFV